MPKPRRTVLTGVIVPLVADFREALDVASYIMDVTAQLEAVAITAELCRLAYDPCGAVDRNGVVLWGL